ncbi:LysR family transcriptional regulator [Streptomyces niveus]|uniref:LysR family transcriptional regulator n=1 Tax=Streptomyces niveus TaxID=193462 RepID=UPI003652B9B0
MRDLLEAIREELGTTQPVLTTQIARLERDLGHLLSERAERGRPMSLTPVGKKIATAVRRLRQPPDGADGVR